jgi:hypothetical protein
MNMPEENFNRLEKWVLGNQEKGLALIQKHTAKEEEVLYWATAWTGPHYILTLFFGFIVNTLKKRHILVVTRKNFLIINIRMVVIEEIGFQSIPIGKIRKSKVRKYPLGGANLCLVLPGEKKLVFKDLTYEWASGLKDAIDIAQSTRAIKSSEKVEAREIEPDK